MTLEYATPRRREVGMGEVVGPLVLAGWWVLYAVVCQRAIGQRGYPPLDAYWQGMTQLWVVGVPLSGLVQGRGKGRSVGLVVYGVATGFVDAASWPRMVPNHVDVVMTAMMTLLFYGPVHVVVAGVVEALGRLAGRWGRSVVVGRGSWVGVRVVVGLLLLVGAWYVPVGYARYDAWWLWREGRSLADAGWASGQACVYSRDASFSDGALYGEVDFDRGTGLLRRIDMGYGWEPAYNARVGELLALHGRPAWAEPAIPATADLRNYLDDERFRKVERFPYRVNGSIWIRGGGWGFSVESTARGRFDFGKGKEAGVYWLEDPAYPDVIFVRQGREELVLLDGRGNLLANMVRP